MPLSGPTAILNRMHLAVPPSRLPTQHGEGRLHALALQSAINQAPVTLAEMAQRKRRRLLEDGIDPTRTEQNGLARKFGLSATTIFGGM